MELNKNKVKEEILPQNILLRICIFSGIIIIGIVFFFHPIFFFNKTFQTGGFSWLGGEVVNGLWSYSGTKVTLDQNPVIDAGSSAYNEELFPYAIKQILSDTQIPLWNPYQACGTPLAANPLASAFYPLMWIACLKVGSVTWDLFLLSRLFIAGILMFGFMRALNVGLLGCVVASFGYIFCGYFTRYINLFHLNVDCLIPGLLWGLELIAKGGGNYRKGLIFTIILFALMFLGAHPEALIIAFGSGFLYLLIRLFTISWTRKKSGLPIAKNIFESILWYIGTLIIGLLISLFMLLPFFEFYYNSKHTHTGNFGLLSIAIFQSITLLNPFFYTPYYSRMVFFPMTSIGFAISILSLFAFPKTPGRRGLTSALFLMIFFIYTKSTGFEFINWIGKLPFLNLIFFTKYQAVMYFAFAVLAGIGIDNLQKKNFNSKFTFFGIIIFLGLFSLLVFRNLQKIDIPFEVLQIKKTFFYSIIFGIIPILILCFLATRERFKRLSQLSIYLLALSVIIELYIYLPKIRADRVERIVPPPYINVLKNKIEREKYPWRIYGVDVALIPLYASAYNLYDVRNLSPLDIEPYWLYVKRFINPPELKSDKNPFFEEMFSGCQSPETAFSKFIDLLGVKYIISESYMNVPVFHKYLMDSFKDNPNKNLVQSGYRHGYYYIGGQTPLSFDFEIDIPNEGDTLIFDSFVDNSEYPKFRGGMVFTVSIEENGKTEKLFRRIVNLRTNPEDFSYNLYKFPLDKYAGKRIKLIFQAEGDMKNHNSIFAIWRHLYLTSWENKHKTDLRMVYDNEVKIYENTNTLPRAFVANKINFVKSENDMINEMKNTDWNPTQTVIMFKDDAEKLSPNLLKAIIDEDDTTASLSDFRFSKFSANQINIEGDTDRAGILVFSDTFYPGWKVKVNGENRNLFRVNLFLRGVELNKGVNKIEFYYSPMSFKIGIVVSMITLLFLFLGFMFIRKKNVS